MKFGFFIAFLILFFLLLSYPIIRGWQLWRDMPAIRYSCLIIMLLLFLSLLGAFAVSFVKIPYARVVALVGFSALLIFVYLIISFFLADIVRVANYAFHFAPKGMLLFRKWFFLCSLAVIAVSMIAGNYKFKHPQIVPLSITNSKTGLHRPLRIVMASDLHLGVIINKKQLQHYVSLINAQSPDMVLFAGDIFDGNITPVVEQNMNEELQTIHAPLGVFAVPGNHEYIGGKMMQKLAYLQQANITVLQDSITLVDSALWLVGRDDRSNLNRKSIAELVATLDKSKPIILLDHQPYHLEEAAQNGIDLQLSGHTHAGQFFPVTLLVKNMYEKAYGYLQKGNTHYYISSGLGLWGVPYRIGSQSELVVITVYPTASFIESK
jgi:predicted MPP superfamily phosphohydrolase